VGGPIVGGIRSVAGTCVLAAGVTSGVAARERAELPVAAALIARINTAVTGAMKRIVSCGNKVFLRRHYSKSR